MLIAAAFLGETADEAVKWLLALGFGIMAIRFGWLNRSQAARAKRVKVDSYEAGVLLVMIDDVRKAYRKISRDHIKCELKIAGQAVQIAQLTEVVRISQRKIKELEDRSDDERPTSGRLACPALLAVLLFAPTMGESAADTMRAEDSSTALAWVRAGSPPVER